MEEIRLQDVDSYDQNFGGSAPGKGLGQGSSMLATSGEGAKGHGAFDIKNAPVVHPIEFETPYWLI